MRKRKQKKNETAVEKKLWLFFVFILVIVLVVAIFTLFVPETDLSGKAISITPVDPNPPVLDNIVVDFLATAPDDTKSVHYAWKKNGNPFAILNLPMDQYDYDIGAGTLGTHDISGNQNHVELTVNAPEFQDGLLGKEYYFVADQYIKIDNLNLDGLDQFTMEFWIKLDATFVDERPIIEDNNLFVHFLPGNLLKAGFYDETGVEHSVQTTSPLTIGGYDYVAIMFTGNSLNIIINNNVPVTESFAFQYITGSNTYADTSLYIGTHPEQTLNKIEQLTMDELKIYDVLLPLTQVNENYGNELAGNQKSVIVSDITSPGDEWQVFAYPIDNAGVISIAAYTTINVQLGVQCINDGNCGAAQTCIDNICEFGKDSHGCSVFAMGEEINSNNLILNYDGLGWNSISSIPNLEPVSGMWGSSEQDFYVWYESPLIFGGGNQIYHYNENQLDEFIIDPTLDPTLDVVYNNVFGFGKDNVFIAGKKTNVDGTSSPILYRSYKDGDDLEWHDISTSITNSLPLGVSTDGMQFSKLFGFSDNDLYVNSILFQQPDNLLSTYSDLFHNSNSWNLDLEGKYQFGWQALNNIFFLDMWGSSSDNIYLSGLDFFSSIGLLFHNDGDGWELIESPPFIPQSSVPLKITGAAENNIYLINYFPLSILMQSILEGANFEIAPLYLYHYDGDVWETIEIPESLPFLGLEKVFTHLVFLDLWIGSEDNIYIVGYDALPDPDDPGDFLNNAVILNYDGSTNWELLYYGDSETKMSGIYGFCEDGCVNANDCPAGQSCVGGLCMGEVICNCAANEACIEGIGDCISLVDGEVSIERILSTQIIDPFFNEGDFIAEVKDLPAELAGVDVHYNWMKKTGADFESTTLMNLPLEKFEIIEDPLISYYFEDISGNNLNGITSSGLAAEPTIVIDGGVIGNGLEFNNDLFFSITDNALPAVPIISSLNEFTIDFWIKLDADSEGPVFSTDEVSFKLSQIQKLSAVINLGSTQSICDEFDQLLHDWNYVAVVFDGMVFKVFVNSEEYCSASISQTGVGMVLSPIYFGKKDTDLLKSSIIDEIKIYDHALPESQIIANYNSIMDVVINELLDGTETKSATIKSDTNLIGYNRIAVEENVGCDDWKVESVLFKDGAKIESSLDAEASGYCPNACFEGFCVECLNDADCIVADPLKPFCVDHVCNEIKPIVVASSAETNTPSTSGGGPSNTYSNCPIADKEKCDMKKKQTPCVGGKKIYTCISTCGTPLLYQPECEGNAPNFAVGCDNKLRDIGEEGIDCGGICPTKCPDYCFNSIKDGDEIDIDCGGKKCKPCNEPETKPIITPKPEPEPELTPIVQKPAGFGKYWWTLIPFLLIVGLIVFLVIKGKKPSNSEPVKNVLGGPKNSSGKIPNISKMTRGEKALHNDHMKSFVKKELGAGKSKSDIAKSLEKVGHKPEDINNVFETGEALPKGYEEQIRKYVTYYLDKGKSPAEIRKTLTKQGWSKKIVDRFLIE